MIGHTNVTEAERVEIARKHLDSAENWIRRIVHDRMINKYGAAYFREGVISSDIRKSVQRVMLNSPNISRDINATSFDQLISIFTNSNHYNLWKDIFESVYPNGSKEALIYLKRLSNIRNSVQHLNGCTSRDLERAVCYSNDIVQGVMEWARDNNMNKEYNVPYFIAVKDNFGNRFDLDGVYEDGALGKLIDVRKISNSKNLNVKDILTLEVEVDPSFDVHDYDVAWRSSGISKSGKGCVASFEISVEDVSESFSVKFTIVTNKPWHRFRNHDGKVTVLYKVLPPIE